MKLFKVALVISVVMIFVAACGNSTGINQTSGNNAQPTAPTTAGADSPPAADTLAAARMTFNAACVRCHKADGEGGLLEIDDLKLKVPNLREGGALEETDTRLAAQIASGGKGMPAFKSRLSPEQIGDLVRFIREEFQGRATTGAAGK